MKFIHIADVHLGAKPDRDKPWGEEREGHSWQAFTDVINRAKEEQVQLLLIAGDLFHRQPLMGELKEVNYQFSRIPQTQVMLIAGNRDFLGMNSCYRAFTWEKNVHFFKEEKISFAELEELGVRVYGLSYEHRKIRERRYDRVHVQEGEYYNIFLGHGGDEEHIPFEAESLKEANFDYVALGHVHKPMQLVKNKVVMAGALQPVSANDTGEHGYFIGELGKEGCKVEFFPLRYCEYAALNLKVNKEITTVALKEVMKIQIRKAPPHQLFKINLTGDSSLEAPLNLEELARMDRVVQVVSRCQPDYDLEQLKIKYKDQIIGRYIETLEEMSQDEITKKALFYGVEALLTE